MLTALKAWIAARRRIRRRWQADARMLMADNPRTSYYEAQRRAAAARNDGDHAEFWHWSKVAAEVARICPDADMDFETLRRIADRERAGR